jgi:hypothetical protein
MLLPPVGNVLRADPPTTGRGSRGLVQLSALLERVDGFAEPVAHPGSHALNCRRNHGLCLRQREVPHGFFVLTVENSDSRLGD